MSSLKELARTTMDIFYESETVQYK